MSTEAGKRLCAWPGCTTVIRKPKRSHCWLHGPWAAQKALVARERAEAVAAERARITAAVRTMFGVTHSMTAIEDEPTRHDVVSRKAVLAIVEEP